MSKKINLDNLDSEQLHQLAEQATAKAKEKKRLEKASGKAATWVINHREAIYSSNLPLATRKALATIFGDKIEAAEQPAPTPGS